MKRGAKFVFPYRSKGQANAVLGTLQDKPRSLPIRACLAVALHPCLWGGRPADVLVMHPRVWALVLLLALVSSGQSVRGLSYKYCIDPATLSLFSTRLADCGIQDVVQEVEDLYKHNAVEFQRGAHELLAYYWLTQPYNPYRVTSCKEEEAVLEYVPLLPSVSYTHLTLPTIYSV